MDVHETLEEVRNRFPNLRITIDFETGPGRRSLTVDGLAKTLLRVEHDLAASRRSVITGRDYTLTLETIDDDTPAQQIVDLLTVPKIDPTPHAAVANAARIALLRRQLLETGAFTYADIAEGRGCSVDAARKSVNRARERNELITVVYDEKVYVPRLVLDETLDPKPVFKRVLEVLASIGETGWAAWAWLATPSSWLDGDIPAKLLETDPDAVIDAARRRASNTAA